MKSKDEKSGIVLQCDPSGEIVRVIRDDLGITARADVPSTFVGIVDPLSQEKAHDFLQAAVDAQATFGWELNVACDGQITGLLFAAALIDQGILVIGSPSRAGLTMVFDEMMKVQNEQVNALRTTVKEERLGAGRLDKAEHHMLEEFTRLNNELVNTQRELARRNAQLASANAALEALSTTDGLTGVKNHRAFQETLEQEWTRALRYGHSLSLLMLDVDRFKQFNDEFGHPAGDRVLKRVARIVTSEVRSDSFVARYGGEEFAVILPSCVGKDAAAVAERVRRAVETEPWDLRPITVSLGSATLTDGMTDRAELVAGADAAMYRAKIAGRNQVCSDGEVSDLVPPSLALFIKPDSTRLDADGGYN